MLLRATDSGWLAITQPAHARVSGQLAAAWGGRWVAPVEPREDIIAGTLLHDIGWLDWEAAPTLNLDTGLPHTFLELPIAMHIHMWRRASTMALAFGRYPALLTSLHGTRLYGARDLSKLDPEEAALVSGFLADERRRQAGWVASLAADRATAPAVADAALRRSSQYVALWDEMSLAICGGVWAERTFQGVPTSDGEPRSLRVWPESDSTTLALDPWPFADTAACVTIDARFINRRFADEEAMRESLIVAPWQTIAVRLVAG